MNTDVRVWLWSADPKARATLDAMPAAFEELESELSRFRADSGLMRLNAASGRGPQRVSQILSEVVEAALGAARATGGLFDPTVLAALQAAGYSVSFSEISARGGHGAPLQGGGIPGARWAEVQAGDRRIGLPAGVQLDLGGIAKGWSVDRIATVLRPLGAALVDAGGDVRANGAASGKPWPVAVADPLLPQAVLAEVELGDEAVVTSSIVRRRWQSGGQEQHHIIDPRTQQPARTDLAAVSVVGPSAAAAEVHAKAALILGSSAGSQHLADRGLSALLVGQDGRLHAVGSRLVPVKDRAGG